MIPIRRRMYEGLAGFTPRQLFAALQGAWLEFVQGSIWQENTGVTPTTTGGQTIGLLLDQSQGAVLGPELVTNGTFDTNLTGWSFITGAFTWDSGAAKHTVGIASSFIQGIVPVGSAYLLTFTISGRTAGSCTPLFGLIQLGSSITTNGTFTYYGMASSGNSNLDLYCSSSFDGSIDNVTVRRILGNHASQSVAANRPTYQLDSNGLPLARHDSTDSLVVSLPNLGGGVYSAAGSVYFATPQGMSALHGQSMGTSYTLPALSTDIYSWIVVPQRLSTVLENRLQRYCERRAWIAGPDYFDQVDYGPELVTNGNFSNGTTGWSAASGATLSASSGSLVVTNSGAFGKAVQAISTVAGRTYAFTVTALAGSNFSVFLLAGTTSGGSQLLLRSIGSASTVSGTFLATGTTTYITAQAGANASDVGYFDNISVRELKDGMTGQLLDDNYEPLLAG